MDYNRIVKDLNGMTREEFLSRMKEHFRVSPCTKKKSADRRKRECLACISADSGISAGSMKKDKSSDPVENLDVFILQEKVLRRSLGSQSQRQMRVFPLPAESAGWIIWKRKWMADGQWHSQCIRPRSRSCSRLRTPENFMPPKSPLV